MKILLLRTDQPDSEITIYDGEIQLAKIKWLAHRQLAETIHLQIKKLLADQNLVLSDIQGIGVFKGPGSFTGLRIGVSVANALADSLSVPIVATADDGWETNAVRSLLRGDNDKLVSPDYGAEPHTTKQKS